MGTKVNCMKRNKMLAMRHRLSWLFYSWCPCVCVCVSIALFVWTTACIRLSLILTHSHKSWACVFVCVYQSKRQLPECSCTTSIGEIKSWAMRSTVSLSRSLYISFVQNQMHTHTTLPHMEYKQAVTNSGIVYCAVASNNLHIHSLTRTHTSVCGRTSDKWTRIRTQSHSHI